MGPGGYPADISLLFLLKIDFAIAKCYWKQHVSGHKFFSIHNFHAYRGTVETAFFSLAVASAMLSVLVGRFGTSCCPRGALAKQPRIVGNAIKVDSTHEGT